MCPLPSRETALSLLREWTRSESLRKHALGVEAALRAMARREGEDEELYGLTGLLHDFDYERYPEAPDHPTKGAQVLRDFGYPEEMVLAILGHAPYTGTPRVTHLAKALFACDELVGFLFACAFVQPDRKIASVKIESARKKLKDKAFARGVNRQDILLGCEELGADLMDHMAFVREALVHEADQLGI